MIVEGKAGRYEVGEQVGEADEYRLYLCTQESETRQRLLQVATTVQYNGELDRAAYFLRDLTERAERVERAYDEVKTDPRAVLNYQLGFPELIDSFRCDAQGERWINVLAFRCVDEVSSMVPLINITQKDRKRVDLRTSAWIMGKLLKLLVFVHSESVTVGKIRDGNIVIEPDKHYVLVFDWSGAQSHREPITREERQREVTLAARAVVAVLGGDVEEGFIPDVADEQREYSNYLLRLVQGGESDAQRAHLRFYEIVDQLWEREKYPFTTYPLT